MAPAKAKRDVSYKDAMEELEDIVAKVDDRNVDIDDLAKNVKRAHELISICQARIEAVRFEVENVMAGASVAPVVVEIEVEEGELFQLSQSRRVSQVQPAEGSYPQKVVMSEIQYSDFEKVEIRVGKVVEAKDFPEARKPAIKLTIDFGDEVGIKKSSAQITDLYTPESLIDKYVLAVTNFPPRQIGPFISEVLTLGLATTEPDDENQGVSGGGLLTLVGPEHDVPLGSRLY